VVLAMGLVVDVTLVGLSMELVVRAKLLWLFVGAMLVALVVGLLAGSCWWGWRCRTSYW